MSKNKPFNLIYEAEWNDIPCVDYPLTPDKWAAECIRPLVGTQVDALFYNLCSSGGYCCGLKNGPLLMDNFEKVADAWVWRYRENTKKLIEADANPPKLAVEYCRRLGIKSIPVVRMNDLHDSIGYKYEVTAFKREHPELLLGYGVYNDWEKCTAGHPDPKSWDSVTWGNFNYACEEVREHIFRVVEEFITGWDNDGVSLDFERHPRFFKEEDSSENAGIMTGLIRRIRKVLDATAARRGRPQYLHVRVLPDIEAAWKRGLDVRTWVDEGLVDAISPGCGQMTFSLDLTPWRKLVEGKNCWIYPANNSWKTPAETCAWAKLMYRQGAHGLYLFNWGHLLYGFDKDSRPASGRVGTVWYNELHPCYYESLGRIGDERAIACKDATYRMESYARGREGAGYGCGDVVRFLHALHPVVLPLEMAVGEHTLNLPFAENIEGARACGFSPTVTLRMKLDNYTFPDKFDAAMNGVVLDAATRKERAVFIMNNDTWIEYSVDPDLLRVGVNKLRIAVHVLNPQMSVAPVLRNVELEVRYVGV